MFIYTYELLNFRTFSHTFGSCRKFKYAETGHDALCLHTDIQIHNIPSNFFRFISTLSIRSAY